MPGRTLTLVLRGGRRIQVEGVARWAEREQSLTVDIYSADDELVGTVDDVLVCFFEEPKGRLLGPL